MRWGLRILVLMFVVFGAAWTSDARAAGLVPCVARVQHGDTVARMLRTPSRFDCTTPQTAFGSGDYWVRVDALPRAAGLRPLAIRSLSLWQAGATLHIRYADGHIVSRAISDVGAARSVQLGAVFAEPLPARGVRATTLLWRVDGSANIRGIVRAPTLVGPEALQSENLLLAALYGMFGGMCLALLVYNLSLWATLRHPFQLAYCAMVASLALYAFSSSGAMAWLWPALGNTARIRVNYLALGASGLAALAFARSFFEPAVFRGAIDRAGLAVAAAIAATTLAFVTLAPWQVLLLDRAYAGAFVGLMLLAVAVLASAWRQRSNYLWLFGLGWGLPVVFAALRVASNFHLVPVSVLLDNSTLVAMAIEAIVSSSAITYRIRLLMVERDEALAREAAARALADTDPLTGLLNRRAFLRDGIGMAEEQLLVLIDIDHFKRINDTLGHDGGDEVLRRIARALQLVAPPEGLVARVGGEEFAILAPSRRASLPEAVLRAVRTAAMPYSVAVTASVGSSAGPVRTEAEWSALYRIADRALYEAKESGRDRARRGTLPLAA